MVEIISKRDGPRREDMQVKRLIEQNRSTIVQLADQISGGGYSASRKPRQQPKAEGLIIHVGGSAATAAEASPSIRVTMNGRVISKDQNTGRQLHHSATSATGLENRSSSWRRSRMAFSHRSTKPSRRRLPSWMGPG